MTYDLEDAEQIAWSPALQEMAWLRQFVHTTAPHLLHLAPPRLFDIPDNPAEKAGWAKANAHRMTQLKAAIQEARPKTTEAP